MQKEKQIEEIIEGFKIIRQHLRTTTTTKNPLDKSLSHSKWLALSIIGRSKQVSIGELSSTLGVTSSAATQLVNSLEQVGYVKRSIHRDDKRTSVISLTPKMKKIFTTLRQQKIEKFSQLFVNFTEADFATYLKLHNKLITAIS